MPLGDIVETLNRNVAHELVNYKFFSEDPIDPRAGIYEGYRKHVTHPVF